MSDLTQTLGIVVRVDGMLELTNGMKLGSTGAEGLGKSMDAASATLDRFKLAAAASTAAQGDAIRALQEAKREAADRAAVLASINDARASAQARLQEANATYQAASSVGAMSSAMALAREAAQQRSQALNELAQLGRAAATAEGQLTAAHAAERAAQAASTEQARRWLQAQSELYTAQNRVTQGLVSQTGPARAATAAVSAQEAVQRQAARTAGQYGNAMAQLPMQITDVITSISSGMPVWLVAIQQGGQIRDSFGGIAPAFRAILSTVTPMTAALGLAGGAAALLISGMLDGEAQAARYRDMMMLTGGAVGLTRMQFDELVSSTARAAVVTQASTRTIAEQLGNTGRIGGDAMGVLTEAAARYQQVSGQTAEKAGAHFAKMASDVVGWATQQNQSMNFATAAQLENIRALQEHGRAQEAMIEVGRLVNISLQGQAENLGLVEGFVRSNTIAWESFKRSVFTFGAPETEAVRMTRLRSELVNLQNDRAFAERTGNAFEVQNLDRQIKLRTDRIAQIEANERDGRVRAGNRAVAAREEQERIKRLDDLRQVTERLSGANSQYMRDLKVIQEAAAAGDITEQERLQKLTELAYRNAPPERTTPRAPRVPRERPPPQDFLGQADERMRRAVESWQERDIRAEEAAAERERTQARAEALREQQRLDQAYLQSRQQMAQQISQLELAGINDPQERARRQVEIEREAWQERLAMHAEGTAQRQDLENQFATWTVLRQRLLTEELKPEWQRMLESWQDTTRLQREAHDNAMTGMLRSGEEAFIELGRTGRLNVRNMVDGILVELLRLQYRERIAQPLSGFLNTFLSAIGMTVGGGAAPTAGTGIRLDGVTAPTGGGGSLYSLMPPRRAAGGPVDRGRLYEVNERGTEVLQQDGRTYLIMGASDGRVIPAQALGGAGGMGSPAASMPPVQVTITNKGGQPVAGTAQASRGAGGALQIDVLLDAIDDGMAERIATGRGSTHAAIGGRFGLRAAVN